ncbi:MAG: SDR family NAD(P)-dependent oxidoreductase [Gemmobacter sp.]|jgi:NAD(P)-dependent dehydrogenase (short-subunit alcohol dehydrogenase family)|nr:SDR family NAD(P)-dependent oxidoreductase [Gemmobacter sp.]
MQVKGETAIISGGASGLGAGTARALAAAGARVVLLDHNAAGAATLAAELDGRAFGLDVTDAAAAETVFDEIGPARILVNCAGVAPAKKMLGKSGVMPLDDFRRVVEVNLIGNFNLLRLFAAQAQGLEVLETGERGVVINTASVAGYEGQIGQTAYAASKGGVIGLTLPAARELAPLGIRVMTIAPGIFETPMLRGLPQAAQDALGEMVPFPSRLGRAEEYAALALHIIANPMLNGEVIRLDGALRLPPK